MLLDYGLVYQLICSDPSQASNFGRKVNLSLTQGFKLNKKFVDAIFISKAPEWISKGNILPAQHYDYQNRRPTLLSSPLVQTDICAEPIIKQIKHWRARVISRDFEAYPKNMGRSLLRIPYIRYFAVKRLTLYRSNPLFKILSS